MKHSILLLLLLTAALSVRAQNAYYDALFCASLNDADLDDSNLQTTGITKGDRKVIEELKAFNNTPFDTTKPTPDFTRARQIFTKIRLNGLSAQLTEGLVGTAVPSLLTSLLNLSNLSTAQVDTLLNGLSGYFTDEFRRSYLETYIRAFNSTLGQEGDLQVMLPATYRKLQSFDPARYKELGNELKRTFNQDLSALPDNLIGQIMSPTSLTAVKYLSAVNCQTIREMPAFPYLLMSAEVGQKLTKGVHPGDIISYLDETYYTGSNTSSLTGVVTTFGPLSLTSSTSQTAIYKSFTNEIHLLNIIQRNLRDTSSVRKAGGSIWINFEDLSKLNTVRKQAYFLALLYREDQSFFKNYLPSSHPILTTRSSTSFSSNTAANGSAGGVPSAFQSFKKDKIARLLSTLVQIDEYVRVKEKDLMEEATFIPFLKLTADLIGQAVPKTAPNVARYTELMTETLMAYNEVRARNYGNLPAHLGRLLHLTEEISPSSSTVITQVDIFVRKLDGLTGFASGVVSATGSEDVKQLLKNYVDPPSSYLQKRSRNFTLSIGGMPGLFLGREKFVDSQVQQAKTSSPASLTLDTTNEYRSVWGLSLPIGFDFSFTPCKHDDLNDKPFSLSVFLQAIDLGAMLNYRLANNTNVLPDKVTLDQIFSPGISVGVGFPNSPLTLSFGYQYAPKLRGFNTTTTSGNAAEELSTVKNRFNANRWQLRLAYDIPLFKLYHSKK